jgi:hypothetical protein
MENYLKHGGKKLGDFRQNFGREKMKEYYGKKRKEENNRMEE